MIIFQNPGLIDVDAITTMGVSVKEGDGAIGYFGTGLKFAIATILRHDCAITIYRGDEALEFTKESTTIRGENFDMVCMNGVRLGFTTLLGRKWEPWMAFRELASNCQDEDGRYGLPCQHHQAPESQTREGFTTIVISGEAIMDVWPDRTTIMLEGEPILSNDLMEIREGPSRYVYYRGVRIATPPRPTALTYNMLGKIELTEDRTAKSWYALEMQIERGIGALDDQHMLRRILTCGELYQEHHMNVPAYGQPAEAFREVARELALGTATEKNANPAAVQAARATAVDDMKVGDSAELSVVQTQMIDKAKAMLMAAGFDIGELPVLICDTLGAGIHGMAKDGRIFLSLLAFSKGTREVAATLLEEYGHLKSGEADCTRGFQNWLFDQILSQAEQIAGQPF